MTMNTLGGRIHPASRVPCLALVLVAAGASALVSAFARDEPPRDETETRLELADLTAYHAALSGKPSTARSASHLVVSFRDLWDHPESWRGRRVEVRGRVSRIFRQGAVGSFPPLAEVWLSTSTGDLICVHCPLPTAHGGSDSIPEIGAAVRFTGTFFKTIRYAAVDQARLAPLIVGNGPPLGEPAASSTRTPVPAGDFWLSSWSSRSWMLGLGLGMAAAGLLAWRHLRSPRMRPAGAGTGPTPPLKFLETEPADEPAAGS